MTVEDDRQAIRDFLYHPDDMPFPDAKQKAFITIFKALNSDLKDKDLSLAFVALAACKEVMPNIVDLAVNADKYPCESYRLLGQKMLRVVAMHRPELLDADTVLAVSRSSVEDSNPIVRDEAQNVLREACKGNPSLMGSDEVRDVFMANLVGVAFADKNADRRALSFLTLVAVVKNMPQLLTPDIVGNTAKVFSSPQVEYDEIGDALVRVGALEVICTVKDSPVIGGMVGEDIISGIRHT